MPRRNQSTKPKGVSWEEYKQSCKEWAIAVHKAKKCLVGYMKDVHDRDDGMTSIAIEDFAHDKGYSISKGKTNAKWLTKLFLSGEDEHISRTSIYFSYEKLYAEYTEEEIMDSIINSIEARLLESYEGRERLALCKYQAEIRGMNWYDVYTEINRKQDEETQRREAENISHKEKYRAYLLSPAWRDFRGRVMKDRGDACEKCGSEHQLQIHHLTYDRIFNEEPEDVQVLCRKCHKKEHGIK